VRSRAQLAPELEVAGIAAFWGSIGLVVREIDLPAVAMVMFRVGIASAGIAAFLLLRPDGRGWNLLPHRPLRTVVQGVVLAAHWALFFAAIQRAPLGTVVLIVYLAPLIIALVAPMVLGERLTRRVGLALVLALIGTALLVGPGSEGGEVTGLVEALLAAVLLAALFINAKVLAPEYGGLRLALAQCAVATVVLLPFALGSDASWPSWSDLGWLLVLGLVQTALALALYFRALEHVPAIHAGVLSYLEPMSATLLGWLVLDEAIDAGTVVGGALVVIGGLLVVGEAGVDEPVSPESAGLPG
jgi:drug/metabolite transporter (DMT)-like permease